MIVRDFRIRGGIHAEPVGEMNVAGNMADLLRKLGAVGNDPRHLRTSLVRSLRLE